MEFDYSILPKKLNLGCGFDKKSDYLNVDLNAFHEPDLVCDVSRLSPLPDGSYDRILANDILEHLPKHKNENTLLEWNRVLKMNGVLEVQVPNVMGLFELLNKPENQTVEKHNELLRNLFGSQNYRGDFHYTGFTELTLTALLQQTGFEVQTLEVIDGWLFRAVATKVKNRSCEAMYHEKEDSDFIKQAFLTVLQREVDDGGYAFYMNMLADGICREAIVSALKDSDEYRELSTKKPDAKPKSKAKGLLARLFRREETA